MAGITDHAMRTFMKKQGASILVTELISSHGVEYKSARTMKLMSFDSSQHPVGIQLFGEDPDITGRAAAVCEQQGCDFVDLNLGCPVPKVVKKGAGSALLKDLPQLKLVLRGLKKAIQIPLTIKIRTGWDQDSRNALEVCQLAFDEGVTWVAVHGRTRAQGYAGKSDWNFIADLKSKSPIPIIGNGDILQASQAVSLLKNSGVDGVMIGRGSLKNPFIFQEAMDLWTTGKFTSNRNLNIAIDNLALCLQEYCEERLRNLQLRKFAAWFSSGYPESSQFRHRVFHTESWQETIDVIHEYMAKIQNITPPDLSGEEFLMGGHG